MSGQTPTHVELMEGDITTLEVDVVVNAANSSLMGGGGVDGAIHRVGGPSILEQCRAVVAERGRCPTGEAVITGAGSLPARWVVHTVGPVWSDTDAARAEALLGSCYRRSLEVATQVGARSIAFPNISTGAYGFPADGAARVALGAVSGWLADSPGTMDRIVFVCFAEANHRLYRDRWQDVAWT